MTVEHDPQAHRFQLPAERGDVHLDYREADEDTLDFYFTLDRPCADAAWRRRSSAARSMGPGRKASA